MIYSIVAIQVNEADPYTWLLRSYDVTWCMFTVMWDYVNVTCCTYVDTVGNTIEEICRVVSITWLLTMS